MLSLANVGGSRDAGRYYEKADDYYTSDRSPSEWQGRGAKVLRLQGEVKPEDFRNLLDGVLPNGETIQISGSGRRGGTDLTFSAPKSISMQALIAGDLRLIGAHDRAVSRSLKYAETLVSYRQTTDGQTDKVLSKNMIAATFRHELSRACDPQLHTHCVVLNMTRREDENWRAMDNELFYRQSILMGVLYRAELGREVQKLGYEIRVTHLDGRFELAHISDSQLEVFSQRSQAIEEALKEEGKTRETASIYEKQCPNHCDPRQENRRRSKSFTGILGGQK
jgi:conjugative relaxase-like TrwC/TraI family protein